jgi:two-component system, sensor histidine kinase
MADSTRSISRPSPRGLKTTVSYASTASTVAPKPVPPRNPDSYILQQVVRMQYANKPMVTWGSYAIALLYAVVSAQYLALVLVWAWVAAVTLVTLTRQALSSAFSTITLDADNAGKWQRYLVFDAAAMGTTWGIAAVLLYASTPFEIKLIIACLIITLSIVNIYASAGHMPTFLAFCVPACSLTAVMFFGQLSGLQNMATGAALLATPFMLSWFARTVQRNTAETMRLHFENANLIEQLQQEKQFAIQTSEQKSRFLAAASHDLRQPLHALGLFAASLKGSKLTPTQSDMLKGVLNSHQAMSDLFDALLDISKLDAGAIEVNLSDIPIQRIFDRLENEFVAITSERDVTLKFYPTSLWAKSDPVLLERILRNLISNALRYTTAGRVVVGVRRRAANDRADRTAEASSLSSMGGLNSNATANAKATKPLPQVALDAFPHLEIQVFDTGVGIAAAQLDSIFEEFYQIGNAERDRRKGLGLGLPIVKRLSNLLRHRLRIVSQLGRGSLFALAVQRGTPYKLDQTITHPLATHTVAHYLYDKLVLIIDDELDIRTATAALLESWKMRVLVAATRQEALQILATEPQIPACILCDYRLGAGENGIAVIAAIREEYAVEIPALLITGDTAPDRIAEAQASGLTVLHKPINGTRLKRKMVALVIDPETAATLVGKIDTIAPLQTLSDAGEKSTPTLPR